MTKSNLSRLIFIDSSVNTHGDHAKVLVPPHPFGAVKSERIALTLISFCARRNWYNVNATNNTFYLYQNGVHYEVQIPPGVYSDFTGRWRAGRRARGCDARCYRRDGSNRRCGRTV